MRIVVDRQHGYGHGSEDSWNLDDTRQESHGVTAAEFCDVDANGRHADGDTDRTRSAAWICRGHWRFRVRRVAEVGGVRVRAEH